MTMAFGLVPALVLVRRHTANDLKAGGRGSSRDRRALHQGLVVAEVALACALLVGSALLVRTVGAMTRVPLGVAPKNVVLAGVQLSAGFTSGAWPAVAIEHATILERIRQQPGVISAGSTNILPMDHGWRNPFQPADQTFARPEDRPQVQYHSVSEGYFETMGATLVDGRAFTAHDTPESEAVVIVNQTLARRYYPGRSAVGREILSTPAQVGPLARNLTWTILPDGQRRPPARTRIVGVVADIQNVALGLPVEPAVYAPTRQFPFGSVTIAIAARDRATAVQAVRSALKAVSPQTPVGTGRELGRSPRRPHRRAAPADDDADDVRRAGRLPGRARRLRPVLVVGGAAPARAGDPPDARGASGRGRRQRPQAQPGPGRDRHRARPGAGAGRARACCRPCCSASRRTTRRRW